jgi:glycine cleavage system transcriptional repressor
MVGAQRMVSASTKAEPCARANARRGFRTVINREYIDQMSTERHLVLVALGPDRPGLVAEVTHYVTERGGNIEDSRMATLGGEFGVMMLVSGNGDEIAKIARETASLEASTGLHLLTRDTKSAEEHRKIQAIPCVILCDALDNQGIVRAVSSAIHKLGLNIVSLETTAYEAPVTGSPLFRLEAQCDVPRGITIAKVRAAMAEVAERENIDVEVKALTR